MNLLQHVLGRREEARYSFDDWLAEGSFSFGGMTYPVVGLSGSSDTEQIENDFVGYVRGAYKADGPIFATILARILLFTEVRFTYQRLIGGRPGDLFWSPELAVLDKPWPTGTTGELLARMEQDVSLAGNAYVVREKLRLRRLRPDWVSVILTAPPDEAVESDVAGYLYRPGGLASKAEAQIYLPEQMEICHWSPIPDPEAQYRGMSWLTPVIRELQADKAATDHKARFFANAATPNLSVSFKESVTEKQFERFMQKMDEAHNGVQNAYKTLYLGGGADVQVIGADLKQLDFRATQGAGETRICAAGGVPPIIVGLSEGLQAATYSNYASARRKFGDHWARPQWRSVCAALGSLVRVPERARLFYDASDIAFLREDERDRAEIQGIESRTLEALIRSGCEPASAIAALVASDWTLLVHTGLYSVQLQPPGNGDPSQDSQDDQDVDAPSDGDPTQDGDDGNAA